MAGLKDREQGFERKFAFDEDSRFRAIARRNRALGMWAAEKLGKTGAEAEVYIREVILSDMQEAGDQDILRKIQQDFKACGVDFSEKDVSSLMDELLARAEKELHDSLSTSA